MMSHCAFVCGLLLAVLAITQGFPQRPAEKPTLVDHLRGLQEFVKLAGQTSERARSKLPQLKKPNTQQTKWIPPLRVSGVLARKWLAPFVTRKNVQEGCTEMYNAIQNTIKAMSKILTEDEMQSNDFGAIIGEEYDIFNKKDLEMISCYLVELGKDKSVLPEDARLEFDAGMRGFTEIVKEMEPVLEMEQMKGSPYYNAIEALVELHEEFGKAGLLS